MIARMERRRVARVTLSGSPTVWTHEGVAARLLDISLHGARLAHSGTLRPGSRCLVQLPTELGSFRLPAEILWCTILGAEVGPDGERYLQAQSGLAFPGLTASQRTGLAGLLQQLPPTDPALPAPLLGAAYPFQNYPGLTRGLESAAVPLPGQSRREASESPAGMVRSRQASPLAESRNRGPDRARGLRGGWAKSS